MHELLETSETAAIRYAGVDRNTSALEEVRRLVVILWMKRPSADDLYSAAGQPWLGVTLILLDLAQRVRASQHTRWPANLFRFANLSATV